jgi:hypothetical protein
VDSNENSAAAVALRDVYENARKAALRAFHWSFARQRAILTADATTPAFRWRFAYALPSNYIRLVSVNGIPSGTHLTCTDVEGGFLMSNESKAHIEYTGDVVEVGLFDEQFVDALSWKLAEMVCPSMLADGGQAAQVMMAGKFQSALAAMSSGHIEQRPITISPLQGSAYQRARCEGSPWEWWGGCPGEWALPGAWDVGFNPYNVPPP